MNERSMIVTYAAELNNEIFPIYIRKGCSLQKLKDHYSNPKRLFDLFNYHNGSIKMLNKDTLFMKGEKVLSTNTFPMFIDTLNDTIEDSKFNVYFHVMSFRFKTIESLKAYAKKNKILNIFMYENNQWEVLI